LAQLATVDSANRNLSLNSLEPGAKKGAKEGCFANVLFATGQIGESDVVIGAPEGGCDPVLNH
jgi:hypothetical protein